MITEDYVSFETAKLLKEKGFDGKCSCYYFFNNEAQFEESLTHWNWNDGYTFRYSAPTLQMATKWLREIHDLPCNIILSDNKWEPCVLELKRYGIPKNYLSPRDTYEEACEAAIKYCLENLI